VSTADGAHYTDSWFAGAPMASLDAAFRTHRGTTPMALLRRKRLELGRDRLLLPEPVGAVRNVAHAAGFLRPEQFAAAYPGEFGETRRDQAAPPPRERSEAPLGPPHALGRVMTTVPVPQEPTVFVVHGDPTLRASMTGLLRKAGQAVQGFASPLAFRAAARSVGPGCVVIDSQLPELGFSESARITGRRRSGNSE
jgi:hypothetical protein